MPACPACGTDNPERARFCLECGLPLRSGRPAAPGSRRTVTVLFSDVVGSTALGELLDPETVHAVMSRYFAAMQVVIERHGGTVEKFIGDAIMAVFGLPIIHEDDALRAVRAALDMREALAELNVELHADRDVTIATRTGIFTGEVVAGDPSARQTMVTGDAVNTAARLEQAAGTDEILIGQATWQLVRDAALVEPVADIGAKGKAEPVRAFRLLGLRAGPEGVGGSPRGRDDRPDAPLVGRDGDLGHLAHVFERVVADREPARVLVLGPAGVGKSRLTAEFISGLADRAIVLRGRCLSYGEGITYWPLREVFHAAAGITDSDTPDEASARLRALLDDVRDGPLLARRLASAIGLNSDSVPKEEIYWAVRRTFGHLASDRPLVVVIEDVHWAEATLLELLDHVQEQSHGIPLLVVCPARLELLDGHPGWGAGIRNATTIELEGLTPEAAAGLLDSVPGGANIGPALRGRILATAEGNPLFIEEMVRMLVEDGIVSGETGETGETGQTGQTGAGAGAGDRATETVHIPPTIQALMAARLDRLPAQERAAAQRASVVGRVFEEVALVALTPPTAQPNVPHDLLELVRKELVAPESSGLTEEDAFKFRHILARDAAYEGLTKSERAELHERFSDWLETVTAGRAMEYQEILGYHLGEAHRYRTELREGGPRTETLGIRAGRHLGIAARRARDRGDARAAVRMYAQAEALPQDDARTRAALLLDHGNALSDVGRLGEGRTRAGRALDLAVGSGDRRLAAEARLLRLELEQAEGILVSSDGVTIDAELAAALADAEASNDPHALAAARHAMGSAAWNAGRVAESDDQLRLAVEHARAAGDIRHELDIDLDLLVSEFAGPTPAADVLVHCRAMIERAGDYPTVRAQAQELMAVSEAWLERFDEARAHAEESIALLTDLAQHGVVGNALTYLAWVYRLKGDYPAAEEVLRRAAADSEAIGDLGHRSFVSCRLAEVLVAQDRFEEAAVALVDAERNPISATRSRIAGAWARIHAARGEDVTALEDVRELVDLELSRGWPNVRAEALADAAHATAALGDASAASDFAREALRISEGKGNRAFARQLEVFLSAIGHDRGPA